MAYLPILGGCGYLCHSHLSPTIQPVFRVKTTSDETLVEDFASKCNRSTGHYRSPCRYAHSTRTMEMHISWPSGGRLSFWPRSDGQSCQTHLVNEFESTQWLADKAPCCLPAHLDSSQQQQQQQPRQKPRLEKMTDGQELSTFRGYQSRPITTRRAVGV